MDEIRLTWRGAVDDRALETLHAAAFDRPVREHGWSGQLEAHSLGWVCADSTSGVLMGFANVAWDGGIHAFLIDVMVAPDARRTGIATAMVGLAADEARVAGCEWFHVDFEPHLRPLYLDACGFSATDAGLIDLRSSA